MLNKSDLKELLCQKQLEQTAIFHEKLNLGNLCEVSTREPGLLFLQ